jgi:Fe-Mn family superoxide dismutase
MTRRTVLNTVASLAALQLKGQSQVAGATLPKLGYATDALEPFIDAKTMEIHHDKHHQAYVDNLNKALTGQPELAARPLDQLLKNLADVPDPIRNAVRNNGGGHANHSLFWQTLAKGKAPGKGRLQAAINKSFGSQTAFEDKLRATGVTVFGSGWVWVTPQGKDGLAIETSPNQDSPWMSGRPPLFGIDVWEHAYYLKYQNRRADYLAAVVQVVNWDFVAQRYEELTK